MENLKEFKKEWQPVVNWYAKEGEDNTMFFPRSVEELDFVKDKIGSGRIWSAVLTDKKDLILISQYVRGAKFYLVCEKQYVIGDYLEIVLEEGFPDFTKDDIGRLILLRSKLFNSEGASAHVESLDKAIKYFHVLSKNSSL